MNVGKTLYFFRKSRGLKQREILDYNTSSVYSKIESEKQELRLSELMDFIEKVDITSEEFFGYFDDEQTKFRTLFTASAEEMNNQTLKKEICHYYFEWDDIGKKSLREISNCVAIRVFFSEHWSSIPPLNEEELLYLFDLLNSTPCFFQYDYILLSNIIFLMNEKQINSLMNKVFPVNDNDLCTNTTQSIITNLVNNLITTYLHKKEYLKATYYVKLANEQGVLLKNIRYKIVVTYLSNLTNYLLTGEYLSIKKVYDCIDFLISIGEKHLAHNMKVDTDSLIVKDKKLGNQTTTHIFWEKGLGL